ADNGTTGFELYTSDATAPGTRPVGDFNPGPDSFLSPANLAFVRLGAYWYFAGNDGTRGAELWRTDGTAAGTTLVKDINPAGDDSNPSQLTVVGNTLFFTADDGADGVELWKTDGSTTSLVRDIFAGIYGSDPA